MDAETRYAKSGDIHIAYQMTGSGPLDLVFVPGFVSHVEFQWENTHVARFLRRLGSFSRLICFDKRGTGLSDRVGSIPTLEERMDDVRAVMDAAGSQRAALLGISEGGPMCALFAATYPERTSALILYGAIAKAAWAPDAPWGRTREQLEARLKEAGRTWGTGASLPLYAPSLAGDDSVRKWWATFERASASPGAALAIIRMNWEIDVRHALPAIHVPTLILHRAGDRAVNVEQGRVYADRIPGAKYMEFPGDDHAPVVGDSDTLLDEIEEFLTGVRHGPEPDRVLATVLFTDIVDSTKRAAELGDRQWADLLEQHNRLVRQELERFRGREIETTGDGFHAHFDGPGRAIRCARAIVERVHGLGIDIRAGLHTGEVEITNGTVRGLALHIGARVAAQAGRGEVLVSNTVKDLVAGSGMHFDDRGVHALKGVPGEWRLFAVERV